MKRLILVLLLLPSLASAQQLLWTTFKTEATESKYIPLDRAPQEVLELYKMYTRFYDGSGFSKEAFISFIGDSKSFKGVNPGSLQDFRTMVSSVEEPTVIAIKQNDGSGSSVTILFVDEEDADLIIFSNNPVMSEMELTGLYGVAKFKLLYKNLFKHEIRPASTPSQENKDSDPLNANYGEGGSGFGDASLSLENRRFVVPPKIEDNVQLSGKVAVEIRVDRDGKIISARAGVRGTTITNNELFEKCERAALGAQLNRLEKAPPVQTGVIVFNFRIDYKSQ